MGLTFISSYPDTTDTNQYTYAVSFGTASSDRYIIVAASARKAGASTTITGVTIGGVTATEVHQNTHTVTNSDVSGIFIAAVPTGTTGDVVVTYGATMVRSILGVWAATELASATAYDTAGYVGTADPTNTLDIPAGGFAIACALTNSSGTTGWTGLTERYDGTLETFVTYSGASDTFVDAQTGLTITADFSGATSEAVASFASWAIGGASESPSVSPSASASKSPSASASASPSVSASSSPSPSASSSASPSASPSVSPSVSPSSSPSPSASPSVSPSASSSVSPSASASSSPSPSASPSVSPSTSPSTSPSPSSSPSVSPSSSSSASPSISPSSSPSPSASPSVSPSISPSSSPSPSASPSVSPSSSPSISASASPSSSPSAGSESPSTSPSVSSSASPSLSPSASPSISPSQSPSPSASTSTSPSASPSSSPSPSASEAADAIHGIQMRKGLYIVG